MCLCLAGCVAGWWREGGEENASVKIYISIRMKIYISIDMNIYVGDSASECALGRMRDGLVERGNGEEHVCIYKKKISRIF